MIERLSHMTIYVLDADEAKGFYTTKLGFNLATDQWSGSGRWLTVVAPEQPDLFIALLEPESVVSDSEIAAQLRALIARGVFGGAFFDTKDCQRSYEQLTARGVEFIEAPTEKPYGIEATFRDNSGNRLTLLQH